eukprot:948973-Lingulodinium_polyedra.AAC.1
MNNVTAQRRQLNIKQRRPQERPNQPCGNDSQHATGMDMQHQRRAVATARQRRNNAAVPEQRSDG